MFYLKKKLSGVFYRALGLQIIEKWKYSINPPYSDFCEWQSLGNYKISPILNKLWLKPSSIRKQGWYLLGIRHLGYNKRSFGIFKSGKHGFSQGRPMYPVRRRWRVIRVVKQKENYLELSLLESEILIKELWLIPLFTIDAWRRIKKRLKTILFSSEKFKFDKSIIWKKYNKLLFEQRKPSNLLNYASWVKEFEKDLLRKILKKVPKNKFKYIIQYQNHYEEVGEDSWVINLEKKDILSKNIYFILDKVIGDNSNPIIIFGDEDYITDYQLRYDPILKSSWNRELFLSNKNHGKSWIIKGKYWNKALNYLKNNDYKVNLFNIIFYIANYISKNNISLSSIIHVPVILYHSLGNDPNKPKSNNISSAGDYINDEIQKNPKIYGEIKSITSNKYKNIFHWACPKETLLSIIIPTKDNIHLLENCLKSIDKYHPGCDIQLIVVDNDSKLNETKLFFNKYFNSKSLFKKNLLRYNGKFNYSKINNYASKFASGNVILLLNNDTEFLNRGWGYELSSNALRPGIGCVGAKLLFEDSTIQHAGIILGIGGIAGHAFKYLKYHANIPRINIAQEYSAVTGACLAISKNNWDKLEGLDEKRLHVNYSDVDICLRALKIGLRNLYLPQIELIHHESKTRGVPKGKQFFKWKKESFVMKQRWGELLYSDPFYHPLLTLDEENFRISSSRKLKNLFR